MLIKPTLLTNYNYEYAKITGSFPNTTSRSLPLLKPRTTAHESDRKATEVLSRYAVGKRNFQCVNLRGQSFKGKNLQGADFSGADLRGTNFKDANLQGAKFTRAKAGLQKRWVAFSLGMSVLASIFSGFCSLLIASLVAYLFDSSDSEEFYIGLFGLGRVIN